ncbi:hypothetical protein P7K49_035499 [Saguinus oedipus]|uniref:Uncharacterized protein n=1 Tax=Saguinus oedipus TaxID=9490 RepID=A0ABQ9TMT1_SAGOE|nr:hypothetical protein P7K49_035499 [Saguinus oedipus]
MLAEADLSCCGNWRGLRPRPSRQSAQPPAFSRLDLGTERRWPAGWRKGPDTLCFDKDEFMKVRASSASRNRVMGVPMPCPRQRPRCTSR